MSHHHSAVWKVVLVVVTVTIVQTGANFMTSLVLDRFPNPMTLSWSSMTTNSLLFLPTVFSQLVARLRQSHHDKSDALDVVTSDAGSEGSPLVPPEAAPKADPVATLSQLCFFYGAYVVANVAYTVAMRYLGVAVVMAMSAATPAFVCVLSVIWVQRPKYPLELAAALGTVAGLVLLAHPWDDVTRRSGEANGSIEYAVGIACGVASPLAATFYRVGFNKYYAGASGEFVRGLLMRLAMINIAVGIPLLALAVNVGGEPSPLHLLFHNGKDSGVLWGMLLASFAASICFNYSVNFAVTITFPLLVSSATIVSAVLMTIITAARTHASPLPAPIAGLVCILFSFSALLYQESRLRNTPKPEPLNESKESAP